MSETPLRGKHTRPRHADGAGAPPQPGASAPGPRNNPRLNARRAALHEGAVRPPRAGAPDPGLTGAIPVIGRHVGLDRTDPDGTLRQQAF